MYIYSEVHTMWSRRNASAKCNFLIISSAMKDKWRREEGMEEEKGGGDGGEGKGEVSYEGLVGLN